MKMKKKTPKLIQTVSSALELKLLDDGYKRVIGIDEVGRGCWAGEVVLGAYVFHKDTKIIPGIRDSKLLSQKLRKKLIKNFSKPNFSVHHGSLQLINTIGIGKTIVTVITDIIEHYDDGETFFLIDGIFKKDFGERSLKIIKGDNLHYSISCASIVAKEHRDSMMRDIHIKYPGYNFQNNVGYGTQEHREALDKIGPCPIHRTSFKPIAELINMMNPGK